MAGTDWVITIQHLYHDIDDIVYSKAIYANSTTKKRLVTNPGRLWEGEAVIPETAPIDSLRWSVTPDDDSFEAVIEGGSLNFTLDVEARDVITIWTPEQAGRTGEQGGNLMYPRFRGYAEVVPNKHQQEGNIRTLSCVGLRNVLYRQTTGDNFVIPGSLDLGAAASMVLSNLGHLSVVWGLPIQYGIKRTSIGSIGIPVTSEINPGSLSVGEVFDALKKIATDSSYTKVAWGVDPYSRIFFKEANGATGQFTEGTDGAEAVWKDVNVTEIVDGVRWFISDGNSPSATMNREHYGEHHPVNLTTPDPLTSLVSARPNSFIGKNADSAQVLDKAITADSGALEAVDGNRKWSPLAETSWVGDSEDGSVRTRRAWDHDLTSYAVFPFDETKFFPFFHTTLDLDSLDPPDLGAISLAISPDPSGAQPDASAISIGIEQRGSNDIGHWHHIHGKVISDVGHVEPQAELAEGFPKIVHTLVFGDRARFSGDFKRRGNYRLHLLVCMPSSLTGAKVAVAEFHAWKLNKERLESAARSEQLTPERAASRVSVEGVGFPYGNLWFTTLSSHTITKMPVEYLETRISGANGVRTTYEIGKVSNTASVKAGAAIREGDRKILLHSISTAGRRKL